MDSGPSPGLPSRLGLGHFSALIRLPDRLPARVWATFRPKTAHDRQQRSQERSKIANKGPESGPRPPTEAQEPPKITRRSPKSDPRPPTEGLRATQDRPQRPQERPKTALIGPKSGPRPPTEALQLHIRPSIENIKEKMHRRSMLPVNIAHED